MRLTLEDSTSIVDWMDSYEVDYSKLVGNHKPPVYPLQEEQVLRDNFETLKKGLSDIIEVSSDKTGKVADKNDRFDKIKNMLEEVKESIGNFYDSSKTVQKEKIPVSNKNKRSLQDVIDEYNKENDYESDPAWDYETFTECIGTEIYSEIVEEHRWYDVQDVVYQVKIDGEDRFFETFDYHITGDNCASDMDLDLPTMKDVREVYPVEEVVTVYK